MPVAMAGAIASGPAMAAPGGRLGTLPTGHYDCEQAGDATGPVGRRMPAADFTVASASSYRANGVLGTYLLTGETMVMTGGPQEGRRFHRQSTGYLREIGPAPAVRCVLRRQNNR